MIQLSLLYYALESIAIINITPQKSIILSCTTLIGALLLTPAMLYIY
ncbi:Uncharacterised protein [Photobacterium damselae]|uniref:Uncharacterized protein n=1 Tax=Photobacterium damselae TaxID=38293 RepID=A0A2X1X257_PHODM|nr:Uncharacterised protein [Photobacterium damselae]